MGNSASLANEASHWNGWNGSQLRKSKQSRLPGAKTEADRAWFKCLLWHPARKRSESILSTPKSTWGTGQLVITQRIPRWSFWQSAVVRHWQYHTVQQSHVNVIHTQMQTVVHLSVMTMNYCTVIICQYLCVSNYARQCNCHTHVILFPSVLWHCWLGDWKGIRPV